MAADASAGDGEAELAAAGIAALPGVEIEAGAAQPAGGEILQRVADGEDAQGAAGEAGALVLRRVRILELQRPLARMPEARAAEVGARRHQPVGGLQPGVDPAIEQIGELRPRVEVEHERRVPVMGTLLLA